MLSNCGNRTVVFVLLHKFEHDAIYCFDASQFQSIKKKYWRPESNPIFACCSAIKAATKHHNEKVFMEELQLRIVYTFHYAEHNDILQGIRSVHKWRITNLYEHIFLPVAMTFTSPLASR